MNLGDKFRIEFFTNDGAKKSIVKELEGDLTLISSGRKAMNDLIDDNILNCSGVTFCKEIVLAAPDMFFFMPTSSTGKHHGGMESASNSVGGNLVHTERVVKMSNRVIRRYKDILGYYYNDFAEILKISCLLHDLCKYPGNGLHTVEDDGARCAELIRGSKSDYLWKELVAYAIGNHMYAWKFSTVWDCILGFKGTDCNGILLSFMLSECDYYSI
jgi:hypothetical protein